MTEFIKTAADKPSTCQSNPTTFSFEDIKEQSVRFVWSGGNNAVLSNIGRRFLVTITDGPVLIISNPNEAVIGGLIPNKNYSAIVKEVFDGQGMNYSSACDEVGGISFKTIGLEALCDNDFKAKITCTTQNSVLFELSKGNKDYTNLSAKIRYKDVTNHLLVYYPTANNILGCKADGSYIDTLNNDYFNVYELIASNNVPWKEQVINPKTNLKAQLLNLSSCRIYEVEIDLIATLGGVNKVCKTIQFGQYIRTKDSNFQTEDVDEDGIPDHCDDELKNPNGKPLQLPDLLCSAFQALTAVDASTLLTTADTGIIIKIAKFPVLITKISPRNTNNPSGVYSGEGIVSLPMAKTKLRVSFSGIKINANKEVVSGEMIGLRDNPANYVGIQNIINNTNNINGSTEFCNKSPKNNAFDANGIHKGTGLKWDESGFGANGQYVKNPPYDNYQTGDPYDPNYDPRGFKADGTHKNGTLYDDFGCDIHGKKADGSNCDTIPPPYYWMNSGSAAGSSLANQVKDSLKTWINQLILKLSVQNEASLIQKRTDCGIIRNAVRSHNRTLSHDSTFTLGENNKWVALGMYKLFETEPDILNINAPRNTVQGLLEAKHKELYGCDKEEYKLEDYKVILAQFGNQIDALVIEYENRIKNLSQSEANNLKNDIAAFKSWLEMKLAQKVDVEYKLRNKITDIKHISNNLNTDLAAERLQSNMEYSQEEMFNIQYQQGWDMINGKHRAFYLEAINKQRLMNEILLDTPQVAKSLPISIPKTVMGRQYEIFLDNLKITTTGGVADAYAIINPVPATDRMIFKGTAIQFTHTGIPQAINLSLATNIPIPLSNVMRFNIKGTSNTFVAFDCEGFKGMGIEADVEICRKYLTPLDPQTLEVDANQSHLVKANIQTAMPSWGEFTVGINITPFAITGFEDVKWRVDSAVLDMSDLNTPNYVQFPAEYLNTMPLKSDPSQIKAIQREMWKGFYLKNLSVTLPKQFAKIQGQPITVAAKDLIIDQGGFTGKIAVSPLFSTKQGNANGWGFSIDTFLFAFQRNNPSGASFNGHIQVPIFGDADTLAYRATMYEGGTYQFSLKPLDTVSINAWFAKCNLASTSTILMQYKDNDFLMEADLTGSLSINKAAKLKGLDSIPFEHLVLRNKAPYFISAGTWGKVPSVGAKIMGFGINIDNVSLVKDSSGLDTKALLNFNLKLNLTKDTSLNITAGGGFQFKCHMTQQNGRHRWVSDGLKIKELYVDGSFGAVEKLAGIITFFDETTPGNTQYGKGFRGAVDIKIKNLAQVKALALFGNVTDAQGNDFRYFFVDALAMFKQGLPIFTGIDLKGLGGGVYYHMNRDTANYKGFMDATTTNVIALPVGASLSGIKYIPDINKGVGIKVSVMIATTKKETAFNANATFEILFNSKQGGGGVSDIWLYGIANFMSQPDPAQKAEFKKDGVKPTKFENKISGYIDLHYSFQEKTFQGLIKAYASLGNGTIKGGGDNDLVGTIEMRFAPNDWYINIGRPEIDKRLQLLVGIPNTNINLKLDAYLDMGKNIPPMPPLPSNVQELLNVGNFMASESTRASGKGFAFGASVSINIPERECCAGVKLFYGQFSAGAGFDVMLQDYGKDAICTNTGKVLGMNGWYASGQIYAYLQGAIGVFAFGNKYPIMEIGAAALLQTKLPNPFWMRGVVGGRYRILGGLVKGNCKFQFEMGKSCEFGVGNNGNSLISNQLITDISPIDKDSTVNVLEIPTANLSIPIDKEYKLEDQTYSLKLVNVHLKKMNSTNDYIDGVTTLEDDNTTFKFEPIDVLSPNTGYEFSLTVAEYKNGAFVKEETKKTQFYTAESLNFIPLDNIEASYPQQGMYNFYQKEYPKGYINLKRGQKQLLDKAPDGFESLILFKKGTMLIAAVPFTYNSVNKKIEYSIPNLPKEYGLQMEIVFMPKQVQSNSSNMVTQNTQKTLASIYFRTSKYDKFGDKIQDIKVNIAKNPNHNNWYMTGISEIFDTLELHGNALIDPLLSLEMQPSALDWLNNDMKSFMYSKFPKKVVFNNGGSFCNIAVSNNISEFFDFSWKKYGNNSMPTLPINTLFIEQPYRVNTSISKLNSGNLVNINVPQNIVFNIFNIVDKDYWGIKNKLNAFVENAYQNCILSTPECMGNPPFYGTPSCLTTKDKCYDWYLNNPFKTSNLAPHLINDVCYDKVISFLNQNGLYEFYTQPNYPQPPLSARSRIIVSYRLPGTTTTTTIDYIDPPQNRPAGNGNGSGNNNNSNNSLNGKTGYAPPSGGGGSRSVVSDAYYIKDFLSLDENLFSLEDAKKEAEDLYNEYGFKTFIIRLPVIAKHLIQSEKKWLIDEAVKDLVARNNLSQKPALVIAMQLENTLDDSTFTYVLNWDKFNKLTTSSVNTRSVVNTLTDLEKESISGYVSGVYEGELDQRLNDSELTYTIRSLNSSLYAKQNLVYNPRTNFGAVTNVKDVWSIKATLGLWNNKVVNNLNLITLRFNTRLGQIDDIISTSTVVKKQKAEQIKNRWSNFIATYFICDSNKKVDLTKTVEKLYENKQIIEGLLNNDDVDVVSINSSGLTDSHSHWEHGFKATINQFFKVCTQFYEEHDYRITPNTGEFHRFDSFLNTDADLAKILNYINNNVITDNSFNLTTEDLKALAATESGDFTNKTIAGVIEYDSNKKPINDKKGVKEGVSGSSSDYVGICQIDKSEYDEAVKWFNKNKTILGLTRTLPVGDYELRKDPRLSFVILAANFAHVLEDEILKSKIFPLGVIPKGIDLKCILFAWYNASPSKANLAFKDIIKNNNFNTLTKIQQAKIIPQILDWYGDSHVSKTKNTTKNLVDFYNQNTAQRNNGNNIAGETYRYIGRIRWRLLDSEYFTRDKIKKLFDSEEKETYEKTICPN